MENPSKNIDWSRQKYENFGKLKTLAYITFDGFGRFGELTLGIWTDRSVRAYNIKTRAAKYIKFYEFDLNTNKVFRGS